MAARFTLKHKYGFTDEEIDLIHTFGHQPDDIEKRYLSAYNFKKLRRYLDDSSWRSIVHNKWISVNFLNSVGISTPRFYGLLHPIMGSTIENESLRNSKDLQDLISKYKLHSFVIKHIGSGVGNNVYVIERVIEENGTTMLIDITGRKFDVNEFDSLLQKKSGRLQGYLVEERVDTHKELKKLAGDGLTSIRINTLIDSSGKSNVQLSFLRLGMPKKATDHSANGGIMVPIDSLTGELKKALDFSNQKWLSNHPLTGSKLEGEVIPNWNKVVSIANNAAEKCTGLRWVGWDVVLTNEGPVILEGNVGVNVSIYQLLFGGFLENGVFEEWKDELGLSLPEGSLLWSIYRKDVIRLMRPKFSLHNPKI